MRSKRYAFKCGGESENKIKGIIKSNSKNIRLEEYIKRLYRDDYERECDNYILRSVDHEIYLQKIKKSSLSLFDDKRCYINETQSILLKVLLQLNNSESKRKI